jgi:hypothetical protein
MMALCGELRVYAVVPCFFSCGGSVEARLILLPFCCVFVMDSSEWFGKSWEWEGCGLDAEAEERSDEVSKASAVNAGASDEGRGNGERNEEPRTRVR